MSILSNFCKIAEKKIISYYPVQIPNAILQVGILNQNMKSLPQLEILKAKNFQSGIEQSSLDTTYSRINGQVVQKSVPATSDLYVGEPYGY